MQAAIFRGQSFIIAARAVRERFHLRGQTFGLLLRVEQGAEYAAHFLADGVCAFNPAVLTQKADAQAAAHAAFALVGRKRAVKHV